MPELIHLRGELELGRHLLTDEEVTIGRLETNTFSIVSPKVSRNHARIVARDGGWVLEDLESANGCYIKDERVTQHVLADGDEVRIANHFLVYQDEVGAPLGRHDEQLDEPWSYSEVGQVTGHENWEALQSVFHDPVKGREGAQRLQTLFEISKILEEAKDFNGVLVQIMDKAIAIMGAQRGFLMLADSETGRLKVHVARDQSGEVSHLEQETISRSLMRKVMESRQPVLVLDAQGEDWGTSSIIKNKIHAAICTPLMTRDTVSGVLYVDHLSRRDAFTKQDLAFFTTFALQAKAAIDSSRAYWELVDSLFKASDDFIVVCSPAGRVTQANNKAAELIGIAVDDLAGRELQELVAAQDRDAANGICRDTLFGGVVSGRELTLLGKEDSFIPLSVSSFALRDRVGNVIGLCLIGRDLTQLKGLIDELRNANELIVKIFGKFLAPEVVEELLRSGESIELGGEKRRVTILMSDLRGFTSVAERLPPEQVVRILNTYLGAMVEVITAHRGTIDEFIGDAILVIFGAPIRREDDALRAAACAVDMQRKMEEVNARNRADGLPEVEMGIALNTGDVVVGNIGSEQRLKYAVVGTHVNLTSRIESNTVGGQILISESTRDAAGDALEIGRRFDLNVKGVQGLLSCWELSGVGGDYDRRLRDEAEVFVDLVPQLAFRFAELAGKQVSDQFVEGEVHRVSARGMEVRSAHRPEPLTNVKLLFADRDGEALEDAYGKVIEQPVGVEGAFYVRFTALPPAVRVLLDEPPRA